MGKVAPIIMGQSPDGSTYSDSPSTYILVQGNADLKDGWVVPRIWTTQATKQAVAGDLIMSVRAPAGAMGKTAYNVVLGRGVAAIKGSEFIYQILVKMDSDGYWKKLSCGSTFESLNSDNIFAAEVSLPSSAEQQKIGQFFQSLDRLITLHQRKYDKLTKVKKSMLEKMFPKNGSNVPEIRFSGFTDAWEQRKLEDVFQKIRNAFVGTATPFYVKDGHFYLESNNVKDGEINRNSEVFINDEFYEKQRDNWLHTGDIVMVQSGHVGHSAVIPDSLNDTAAHALIIIANPKQKICPHFINVQFMSPNAKKNIGNITTGNTIKHILASDMKVFEILLPSYAEQTRIGQFFRSLDSLITLHQRELDRLQKIKKSCLEKMFV